MQAEIDRLRLECARQRAAKSILMQAISTLVRTNTINAELGKKIIEDADKAAQSVRLEDLVRAQPDKMEKYLNK